MTAPKKAIESRNVRLTPEEIAKLKGICERTLNVQPQLMPWVKNITVAPGVSLPFLPIRCFRLTNVSRFVLPTSSEQIGWKAEFLSSGSTNSLRARHRMSAEGLEAYRASANLGWQNACIKLGIPAQTHVLSLVPSAANSPDSSLSMMLSFWSEAGVPVHFIDLNPGAGALETSVKNLQTQLGGLENFVLFGTSLHHLQVLQWQRQMRNGQPFLQAERVWCFDTGGTKGRTQSTNQAELYSGMRSWFTQDCKVELLSEYGMCELSSQAYAARAPHTDLFECSPQLRAVAIAPQLDCVLPHAEKGFLGFIDFANVDSWPCLISEDLGMTIPDQESHFRLCGRAPDATLKGCSLNVRDTFRFDLNIGSENLLAPEKTLTSNKINSISAQRTLPRAEALLSHLSEADWPASARKDLLGCLLSWDADKEAANSKVSTKLTGESIAIVSSANIPVAWLFPALHAWIMEAAQVTLYLPSLRPDDPLTALVRRQIVSLADAFNTLTHENFIEVRNHRLFAETNDPAHHAKRILVFGSDDTLRTISRQLANLKDPPHLIALGHFQNSMTIDDSTNPEEYAQICALWMGRGCLTPLQLGLPPTWEHPKVQAFATELYAALRKEMKNYLEDARRCGVEPLQIFSHQHNLAELQALATEKSLKIDMQHCSDTGIVVVNAFRCGVLPEDFASKMNDFAGCGWINLISAGESVEFKNHNPNPGLFEPHQGSHWRDWFFKTLPNGV